MNKVNKWLIFLNIVTCMIGLILIKHIVVNEKQHRQTVYELKTEVREREFDLEMATMRIEWLNKEEAE